MRGARPLTQNEANLVRQQFTGRFAKRDCALFELGIKTGFRISELLSIRIGDVLCKKGIADRLSIKRANMKGKTEGRSLLLHPKAKMSLRDWLNEFATRIHLQPNYFVFSGSNPNRPITRVRAWQILNDSFIRCNVTGKLGTHVMRKTYSNRMYELLEKDLVKVQRALGHRNINSTVAYLSFREEDIDEAILAS